ncbi:exocyst subunit exo70 family protein D3 [Zostera marina]|uniref:Exocyst subunit Exo70 family protein n=1 Tax=Zostera marina TaxID=29655 RepID=A0A0K9PYD6_ZOSMR|nr:exocyst subunit exo70 family protein D3 [Zostera marina]
MNASDDPISDEGEEKAKKVIERWDSTSTNEASDQMLFEGTDRTESERFLHAVDEMRRFSLRDSAGVGPSHRRGMSTASESLHLSMARLEDEFRNILISRVNIVEKDLFLSDLASVNSFSSEATTDEAVRTGSGKLKNNLEEGNDQEWSVQETETMSSVRSSWRWSMSRIREIDLLPEDAVKDLRSIADRMITAGYARECFQTYSGVRKTAVEQSLRTLGLEKLSIGDVQRLESDTLERKISQWVRAAPNCVRIIFASERRLCDLIFEGLLLAVDDGFGPEIPFAETVKGPALQLFGFAEAISIGRRSPEKLFKILDLHNMLSDLLSDVEVIFQTPNSEPDPIILTQASEILSRLVEATRGTLSQFENAVYQEQPKPVPGGALHPLTRYVMNYITLICEYKQTLLQMIISKPPSIDCNSSDDSSTHRFSEVHIPVINNKAPLAGHLIWIIVILHSNIETTAKLYKDKALGHIFLMNNLHYIVDKAKVLPELLDLIGDDYLKRLSGRFQQTATNYERAAWVKVLHCLRDEGIHVKGSFSSGISKATLKERFKSFNAAFDEAHKTQSCWYIPDSQLREELRISMSEKILSAYRSFLGRFSSYIESGKHPEMFIKYSVDDLEFALSDFFEGTSLSIQNRRKPH